MSEYSKEKERMINIRNRWWKCPHCGQSLPTINKDIHLKYRHPLEDRLSGDDSD